jgi:hypothetical protein
MFPSATLSTRFLHLSGLALLDKWMPAGGTFPFLPGLGTVHGWRVRLDVIDGCHGREGYARAFENRPEFES